MRRFMIARFRFYVPVTALLLVAPVAADEAPTPPVSIKVRPAVLFAGGSGGIEFVKGAVYDDERWSLSFGLIDAIGGGHSDQLDFYLYSRAQSVMGGTSQVQKNIIATRILDLPVG